MKRGNWAFLVVVIIIIIIIFFFSVFDISFLVSAVIKISGFSV